MLEDVLEFLWKILRWLLIRMAVAGLLLLVLWLVFQIAKDHWAP